jgi:hypothetical protein
VQQDTGSDDSMRGRLGGSIDVNKVAVGRRAALA